MSMTKEIEDLRRELKSLKKEVRENRISDMGKNFDQLLNRDMKSYEDNFRITGFKYDIRDAQKEEEEYKDAFINRILNIFVNAKAISADKFFFQEGKEKGRLRPGVLRNLHPLSQKSNSAIVVAFVQSWMTARIRQQLQGGNGTLADGVKICAHYPPIIEALKNEAMKERKRLLDIDRVNQRVVVNVVFKKPWVILLKMTGRDKKQRETLSFPLEDGRLSDPGRCLAELALAGKEFVPKHFIKDDDAVLIAPGRYAAGPMPQKGNRNPAPMDTN